MSADWATATLGTVCEIYQPKTISQKEMSDDAEYPVFGANGQIGKYDKYNHEDPQLLITCRGATCGSVNISAPFSWITGNAMVVRPKQPNLDLNFVEYFFRGAVDLDGVITGAAQPQITRKSLAPVIIPVPPLEEQKRIVVVLDKAFAALDRARALAEANLADAEELHPSFVTSFISTSGAKWLPARLGDVYDVRDGTHDSPKYQETGRALVTSKNLGREGLNFNKIKFISDEDFKAISKRSAVNRGDVLFAMIGTIGNPTVVNVVPDFAIKNVALFKMQTGRNGRVLRHLLSSRLVQEKMAAEAKGTTQQFVGLGYLRAFELKMPKSEDEPDVLAELDKSEALSSKLRSLCLQKLEDIEDLHKSILQKAFAGELT